MSGKMEPLRSTFTATAAGTYYLDITFSQPIISRQYECRVLKNIYAIDCDSSCAD